MKWLPDFVSRRRRIIVVVALVGLVLGMAGPWLVRTSHHAWWAEFLYVAGIFVCFVALVLLTIDWFRDLSRRPSERSRGAQSHDSADSGA